MHLDRDGVISILLGVALFAFAWLIEAYVFSHDPIGALIAVVKDMIVGGIAGMGLLLVIVGILFILAW